MLVLFPLVFYRSICSHIVFFWGGFRTICSLIVFFILLLFGASVLISFLSVFFCCRRNCSQFFFGVFSEHLSHIFSFLLFFRASVLISFCLGFLLSEHLFSYCFFCFFFEASRSVLIFGLIISEHLFYFLEVGIVVIGVFQSTCSYTGSLQYLFS